MQARALHISILILSTLGFTVASYLAIEHFRGELPVCGLLPGCDKVLTSPYNNFFGIPLAVFGMAYYLFVFLGTVLYLDIKNTFVLKVVSLSTLLGAAFSFYFVYLQAFVIGAFCMYCMASALFSFMLCGIGMYLFSINRIRNPRL